MDHMSVSGKDSDRGRWILRSTSFIGVVLLFVWWIRACMSVHSRPIGHDDITFDIAPNGDQLVFNASGGGTWDLYLLDLTTNEVHQICSTPAYELTPRFSPDGEWVVYGAGLPADRADHIFIRSVDGAEVRQLTALDANDTQPAFSPDGTLVVFARDKDYSWGGLAANWSVGGSIHIISSDGGDERQLTSDSLFAWAPEFSQDGATVQFCTHDGRYSIPIDGSEEPNNIGECDYTTTRDGRLIAFTKGRYALDQEIFVATADRSAEWQVTDSDQGSVKPMFAPGGDRLFFLREFWPNGPRGFPKYSLWEVAVDGESLRNIADSDLFDAPLSWHPTEAD